MAKYLLSPQADEDLESIIRYTLETWGDKQTEKYVDQLEACLDAIGRGEAIPRRFSRRFTDLCVLRCQRHFIFYLKEESVQPPMIIALLHEKMDLVSRVIERLDQ